MINNKAEILKYFNVSRETEEKLNCYEQYILKWQKTINLVSNNTLNDIWVRHFCDSMQLIDYIKNPNISLLDLGSGAGFPGLVLAIMGIKEVILVESDLRKSVFLQEVANKLNLNVKVINKRIEKVPVFHVDHITARALSSLKELLFYTKDFITENNNIKCLFLKGANVDEEIGELLKANIVPNIFIEKHKSLTSDTGVILSLTFNNGEKDDGDRK